MAKYYTLLTRDDVASPWCIAHGDYDRATVQYEQRDMVDYHNRQREPGEPRWFIIHNTAIMITKDARQSTIVNTLGMLNGREQA